MGAVKVGSRLLMLASLDRARVLVADDHRMFLALKFHDTPNTVTQAAESAVQTGA